jgi:hypothetical protein
VHCSNDVKYDYPRHRGEGARLWAPLCSALNDRSSVQLGEGFRTFSAAQGDSWSPITSCAPFASLPGVVPLCNGSRRAFRPAAPSSALNAFSSPIQSLQGSQSLVLATRLQSRQAPPLPPRTKIPLALCARAPRSLRLSPSDHTATFCSSLYTSTKLETITLYSTVTYYSTSYTLLPPNETPATSLGSTTSERVSLTGDGLNPIARISARVSLATGEEEGARASGTVLPGRVGKGGRS